MRGYSLSVRRQASFSYTSVQQHARAHTLSVVPTFEHDYGHTVYDARREHGERVDAGRVDPRILHTIVDGDHGHFVHNHTCT